MIIQCPTCARHYSTGNFDACPHCPTTARKQGKSKRTRRRGGNTRKRRKTGKFDSKTEGRRYHVLCLLARGRIISNLETQPQFELLPRMVMKSNGIHRGFTQSREIYTADFRYTVNGVTIVEDVKGIKKTKAGNLRPYIKTPSRNKMKHLVWKWQASGIHDHTLLITCEQRGRWLYFDSNGNLLDFELKDLYKAA